MVEEPQWMHFHELNNFAELLMGKRNEAFKWEREVRLFQFQAWIAFPKREMIAPTVAGRLIATAILNEVFEEATTALQLGSALRKQKYRELFDGVIGAYGGWTRLGFSTNSEDLFTDEAEKRVKLNFEHVALIVEERLNIVRQDGSGERASPARAIANLVKPSHAAKPMINERSFHLKWGRSRDSAFFIYLIEKCGFTEMLLADDFDEPLAALTAVCRNKKRFQEFFGMYTLISS